MVDSIIRLFVVIEQCSGISTVTVCFFQHILLYSIEIGLKLCRTRKRKCLILPGHLGKAA